MSNDISIVSIASTHTLARPSSSVSILAATAATTVTVPNDATASWAPNTVWFISADGGAVTLSADSPGSISGGSSVPEGSAGALVNVGGSNTWALTVGAPTAVVGAATWLTNSQRNAAAAALSSPFQPDTVGAIEVPVPVASGGTGATTAGAARRNLQALGPVFDVTAYGAVGNGSTDDTAAIEDAMTAGTGGLVRFPAPGVYMVAEPGIFVPDGTTVEIEAGATVEMIANSSTGSYAVFHIDAVSDVTIMGGGTIKGDRAGHSGTGTSGMGVLVTEAERITLKDFTTIDHYFDGIYIGGAPGASQSAEVDVINVTARNNRRQGMSVTHCRDLRIVGFRGLDTNGTAPQSGIDLEPNTGQTVENVRIVDAFLEGNTGDGLKMNSTHGTIRDITIDGAHCSNNTLYGIETRDTIERLVTSGITCVGNQQGWQIIGDVTGAVDLGTVTSNTLRGVLISDGSAQVCGGSVVNNTGDGVTLIRTTTDTILSRVLFAGNITRNLDVRSTSHATITHCTFVTGSATPTNHLRVLVDAGTVVRLFNYFDAAASISDTTSVVREDIVNQAYHHRGSAIGFFGVTPAARAAAYTASNVTTDRSYNANATTLDELADVVGTLIADLRTYGLLQ